MTSFIHENFTIRIVVFLTGIQILISSLECLYGCRIYRNGQLLSWKFIKQSRKIFKGSGLLPQVVDFLFEYPRVLLLFALRAGLDLYLLWLVIIDANGQVVVATILLVTLLGVLLTWRNTYSNNGADQLANIILISVCISTLEGEGSVIKVLSLIFIACQSQLSYLTSGFFKLLEKDWRSGVNLRGVFSTQVFGHPVLKRMMDKWAPSYRVMSFFIIYGELAMGCAMFFPPKICLIMLCIGMLFHFMTAVVMGLNAFLWTFVATYPAIYFLCLRIHA